MPSLTLAAHCMPVLFPAVPQGKARLRLNVMATHTDARAYRDGRMNAASAERQRPAEPLLQTGPLSYRWVGSIDAIKQPTREECFGRENVYDAFELARSVERANLQGFELHYLLGERAGEVVFILPCFRYRVSLSLLAPRPIQRAIDAVRRLFPGAMFFNMFVAGSPVAICKDSPGMKRIPEAERLSVLVEVKRRIMERSGRWVAALRPSRKSPNPGVLF
jgi:hypothetical protein